MTGPRISGRTFDHDKALELWASGKTAREICAELGVRSQNTVKDVILEHRKHGDRRATIHAPGPPRGSTMRKSPAKLRPIALPPPLPPVEPIVMRRVSLLALEASDCRYPLGDPADKDFAFCGLPVAGAASYCPYHQLRCYTAAPPRKPTYNAEGRK